MSSLGITSYNSNLQIISRNYELVGNNFVACLTELQVPIRNFKLKFIITRHNLKLGVKMCRTILYFEILNVNVYLISHKILICICKTIRTFVNHETPIFNNRVLGKLSVFYVITIREKST